MKINEDKIVCTRCVYDNVNIRKISFDEAGVCNYCHQIDDMKDKYKTGTPEGVAMFEQIVDRIKVEGKGKPYDCVMGVSGGTDSSYLAYLAVENRIEAIGGPSWIIHSIMRLQPRIFIKYLVLWESIW